MLLRLIFLKIVRPVAEIALFAGRAFEICLVLANGDDDPFLWTESVSAIGTNEGLGREVLDRFCKPVRLVNPPCDDRAEQDQCRERDDDIFHVFSHAVTSFL